jgi:hypothetical protein
VRPPCVARGFRAMVAVRYAVPRTAVKTIPLRAVIEKGPAVVSEPPPPQLGGLVPRGPFPPGGGGGRRSFIR